MSSWDYEGEQENDFMSGFLKSTSMGLSGLGNTLSNIGQSPLGQAVGSGFSALGATANNGLEMLRRPSLGVRNVEFGNYDNAPDMGGSLGTFDQMTGNRLGMFSQGLAGQGTQESGNDALERYGWGTGPELGPFNARNVAGFANDVLTDPLNLFPGGAANNVLKNAQRAEEFGPTAGHALGELVPRGKTIDSEISALNAPKTGLAQVPAYLADVTKDQFPALSEGIGKAARFFDPRLLPENDAKKAYTAAMAVDSDKNNVVSGIEMHFRGDEAGKLGHNTSLYSEALTKLRSEAPEVAAYNDATKVDFTNTSDVIDRVNQMDLARKLVPVSKQIAFNEIKEAQTMADTFQEAHQDISKFKDLLNRSVRGENLPDVSIESFGETFPDFAAQLQKINDLRGVKKAGTSSAASLNSEFLRTQVVDQERLALAEYRDAKAQVTSLKALSEDRIAGLSAIKNQDYLKGLWFDPQYADQLSSLLGQRAPGVLRTLSEVNGTLRTIEANADISAPMIQGLPVLVKDPVAFLKAYVGGLKQIVDPEFIDRYRSAPVNQEAYARYPGLQAALEGNEYGKTLSASKLGNTPVLGGLAKGIVAGENRLSGSFNAFGIIARTELAKSLGPIAERANKVPDMVDTINHLTGIVDTAAMGVSPTQRAFESGFMGFAPRYTRSVLALAGDIINGGQSGEEAAGAIGSMLTAGIAGYIHFAENLGQAPMLDPKDSRFLTLEVGGSRMGPGSVWVSLARTAAAIKADPGSLGAPFTTGQQWTPVEAMANPLFRFWRGHAAPTTAQVWDLAAGESYIGTPLKTIPDQLKHAAGMFAPFGLQGVIAEWGQPGTGNATKPEAIAGNILGLRQFPQRVSDIQEQQSQKMFQTPYDQLDPVQQAQIRNTSEVKALPAPQGQRYETQNQKTVIMNRYSSDLEKAAQMVTDGKMDKSNFRAAETRLSDVRDAQLQALPTEVSKPSDKPMEQARQHYLGLFHPDNITGAVDYDSAEGYYATLDPDTQKYIDQKRLASLEYLGPQAKQLMTDLQTTRSLLRPYWEVEKTMLEKVGHGILEKVQNASPAELDQIKQKDPYYAIADKLWTKQRDMMRMTNPKIDQALVDWGYVKEPIFQRKRR